MMLGIIVPQKKSAYKKRGTFGNGPQTEEVRKRKKRENGRKETARMGAAVKIIEKYFGMKKATRRETLARLVEEGEFFLSSEPCA